MPLPDQLKYKLPFSAPNSQGLVEASFPLPIGSANELTQLRILCDEQPIACCAKILTRWYDKSIHWVHIIFCDPIGEGTSYELVIGNSRTITTEQHSTLLYKKTDDFIEINHAEYICHLNTQSLTLDLATDSREKICHQSIELFDREDNKLKWQVSSIAKNSYTHLIDGSESIIELAIEGHAVRNNESEDLVRFSSELLFFSQRSCIKHDFTIHNPKAAQHSNGQWDLGDPASFYFNTLNVAFSIPSKKDIVYQTEPSTSWYTAPEQGVEIYQHSSGGDNWLSPVHVDKTNSVPHKIKGYEYFVGDEAPTSGSRATPIVSTERFSVTLKQFWQNFPKALSLKQQRLNITLFPKLLSGSHELQAGEKKTHSIWIETQAQKDALEWVHMPKPVLCPLEFILANESIYGLPGNYSNKKISSLINEGLQGTGCFFKKREILDEFGWRNFGDLYADHETAGYKGEKLFVSHYNNQYDPIFGFLKQYLMTGDRGWFELADDLAKHVKNIDIYHTELDKKEYNGGLFWHTDHYLEAFTSSHRSYSKYQTGDAYQDHAGGGGPGGQHCYTTGLKLHYNLSGSESSKQAVLTLSKWITNVYEGSGTCFELLLALKNRHVVGLKNHFTGQYPLDRGTANYLIALIDSYELSQDLSYLNLVETILKNTMHPTEDIAKRELHDVEGTWFYTVLLQALCRYLHVKQQRQELDNNFYYCRDCLLNFADWMLENEYPYLEKPEILEYPNDTWTAQDLRKAHIFAAAYHYGNKQNVAFLDKAHFFEDYVATKLNSSETKTYTRILVLLMQNHGAVDFYKASRSTFLYKERRQNWPAADYQKTSIQKGLVKELFKRLSKLSIKDELTWLKTRLS